MTDQIDMIRRRVRIAPPPGRALERWGKLIALALAGVVGSWVVVTAIRHRDPQAAQAQAQHSPGNGGSSGALEGLSYVGLTRIPGRHDHIARDFFTRKRDAATAPMPVLSAPAPAVSAAHEDTSVPPGTDELELKAIILGQSPQAFINDGFVTVGDTVPLAEPGQGEHSVVAIYENSVVLKWGTVETVLQLNTDDK